MSTSVVRERPVRAFRLSGVAIAAALVAAVFVAPAAAHAEDTDTGLVAWYKLNETSGAVVADSSPSARAAAVVGTATWNNGAGFTFSGGNASAGSAIKLPNDIIKNLDSVTVSADVLVDTTLTGSHFIYNLGNLTAGGTAQGGTGYLFSTATAYQAKITNTAYGNEKVTSKGSDLTKGVWKHITYTQTGTVGTLFEDGVQVAQNTAVTYTPAMIGSGTTTHNYLGRSAYSGDASFKGRIRDFRIYDRALTTSQVAQLSTETATQDLSVAVAALTITSPATISANITVPTTAVGGAAVKWTSTKPHVLSSTGTVIRPSENVNETVTLTATVSLRGQSSTKSFTYTVLADPSNDGKVQHDASRLALGDLGDVRADLQLPLTAPTFASSLAWSTSDAAVVSATGVVSRPAFGDGDATATLTATATRGGLTASGTYPVTVRELERVGSNPVPTTETTLTVAPVVGHGVKPVVTAKVVADDGGDTGGLVRFSSGEWSTESALVNGIATTVLSESLTVGNTTVTAEYLGYKNVLSSMDVASVSIRDLTAPFTTAVVGSKSRLVTLTATDAVSGVSRIEYRFGTEGPWIDYTAPVLVGSGAVTVQYRAADNSRNVEATNTVLVPDLADILVATQSRVIAITPTTRFGTAGSVTVRVTAADVLPTGTVRVVSGSTLLGTGSLVGGRATITLATTAAVATHDLNVIYSGDFDHATSETTAQFSVTKALSATTVKMAHTKITTKKRAVVTATVTPEASVAATGTVTVKVSRSGKTVKSYKVAIGANGAVKLTLPKLKAGSYKVAVSYPGSSSIVSSSKSATFKVTR